MSDVKVEILKDTIAGKQRVQKGEVVMVSEDDFRTLKTMGRAQKSDKKLSPKKKAKKSAKDTESAEGDSAAGEGGEGGEGNGGEGE